MNADILERLKDRLPHLDNGPAWEQTLAIDLRALIEGYEAVRGNIEMPDGHNQPCVCCGQPCNALHGNPGLWPIRAGHPNSAHYYWRQSCLIKHSGALSTTGDTGHD